MLMVAEEPTGAAYNDYFSTVLAAQRTNRRNPLNQFNKYSGGWNLSDTNYWAVINSAFNEYFEFIHQLKAMLKCMIFWPDFFFAVCWIYGRSLVRHCATVVRMLCISYSASLAFTFLLAKGISRLFHYGAYNFSNFPRVLCSCGNVCVLIFLA